MDTTSNTANSCTTLETWRLDASGIWAESWVLMKQNYGTLVGASAIVVVVAAAMGAGIWHWHPGYIAQIPWVLVFYPLYTGLLVMGVSIARGGRPALGELLVPMRRYWTLAAIFLIEDVLLLIIQLPQHFFYSLVRANPSMPLVCASSLISCCVVLPLTIFVSTRLWSARLLCLDGRVGRPGLRMSLASSWAIGGQSFWPMFGVLFVSGFILLGSLLLAGVGVVFLGLPVVACACGVMYTRIVDSVPRTRCPDCGCDVSASATMVCPVCGVKAAGSERS